MCKRRLTNREELRRLLKEATPDSVLQQELLAVLAGIEQPQAKAVSALTKLLQSLTTQKAKHFTAIALGSTKDPRAIRPLMRAAAAPENENYSANFLWPLVKYDCTARLQPLVNFIVALPNPGEAMLVAVMIIREMKGPFDPILARRCIRRLLTEVKAPEKAEWKLQTEALRLEAADFIMAKYFNQMRLTYWKPRKGSIPISKTA